MTHQHVPPSLLPSEPPNHQKPPLLPSVSPQRSESVPPPQGCIGRGAGIPPPSRAPSLCPTTVPQRQVPALLAFVTDSNRPQPLWQPPSIACPIASGATPEVPSLLMHPCPQPPLSRSHPCALFLTFLTPIRLVVHSRSFLKSRAFAWVQSSRSWWVAVLNKVRLPDVHPHLR